MNHHKFPLHRETEMSLLPGHLFSQNLWEADHLWLPKATCNHTVSNSNLTQIANDPCLPSFNFSIKIKLSQTNYRI